MRNSCMVLGGCRSSWRTLMVLITSPDSISDPYLRRLGNRANRLAPVEAAIAYLDDLAGQSHSSAVNTCASADDETVRVGRVIAGDDRLVDSRVEQREPEHDAPAFAKHILSERLGDERGRLADDLGRW